MNLLQSAVVAALLQAGFLSGLQVPAPVGLVNDFANVIPVGRVPQIEQIAADVRAKSRGEIAVVTLADIGDRAPADVALGIGRQWKVGKIGDPGDPTRNAGAVILLVPKETSSTGRGECYVATGSGAEGFITDGQAGAICREAIPYFRGGDYGAGITLITYRVAERFASEFGFTLDTAVRPVVRTAAPEGRGRFPIQLIIFAAVFAFMFLGGLGARGRRGGVSDVLPLILLGNLGGGRHRGGWGGGGFGGGGGGFGGFGGGGGFSGGGGGSSW